MRKGEDERGETVGETRTWRGCEAGMGRKKKRKNPHSLYELMTCGNASVFNYKCAKEGYPFSRLTAC